MKRAIGALETSILSVGCLAAMPLFAAVLAAMVGMLTAVGLYVWRLTRHRPPAA